MNEYPRVQSHEAAARQAGRARTQWFLGMALRPGFFRRRAILRRKFLLPCIVVPGLICGFRLAAIEAEPPAAAPVPPPSAPAQRSAADLEKLAMPIALYPDNLIAITLPASVYPLEVVQAARFVKDTNNVAKLDQQPWDENVKAVARVPELIAKMDAELAWTTELGQAFLDQPAELMDAIQRLRAKAQQAGTLQTTPQQVVVVTNMIVERTIEQQVVVVTNTVVEIQPANPEVVYVPTYSSAVYYPPPAYVYNPYAPLVTFGAGVAVGVFIANNCDWHYGGVYHSDVNIDVNRDINRDVNRNANRNVDRSATRPGQGGTGTRWQPDQNRLRTSGAPPSAQTREARGWGTQPSQRPTGAATTRPGQQPSPGAAQRPAAAPQPSRPPGAGQRPAGAQKPTTPSTAPRPSATPGRSTPSQVSGAGRSSSSAFSGINNGSQAKSFSNRGAASRGSAPPRGGGRGRR